MYPQTNAARSVRDLSGVWDFRFNANDPWQPIAVPASYNDRTRSSAATTAWPTTVPALLCQRVPAVCCGLTP